jgi:PEP-CTERM motif-containing protein
MAKLRCFALLTFVLFTAALAKADGVTISGTGVWGSGAPTSDWSTPGASWSFSLVLPNPTPASPNNGTAEMLVTDITSFSFTLNGVAVNIAPSDVLFFPSSEDGGFDIDFTSGGSDTTNGITCSPATPCSFNVFGNQVFSGTSPFITILQTSVSNVDFDYTASTDETNPNGTGTVGTFTVVATPEPATVSLLALGLAAFAVKRKKK